MAKITRTTQKVFAGNSGADEVAVFGSMNTTPEYTINPSEIMASVSWGSGFSTAVSSGFAPFLEEMNGVNLAMTSQIGYIFQEGVAEYDANTTYYENSIVKGSGGSLYISITNDNTGNPLTDTTNWKKYSTTKITYWE